LFQGNIARARSRSSWRSRLRRHTHQAEGLLVTRSRGLKSEGVRSFTRLVTSLFRKNACSSRALPQTGPACSARDRLPMESGLVRQEAPLRYQQARASNHIPAGGQLRWSCGTPRRARGVYGLHASQARQKEKAHQSALKARVDMRLDLVWTLQRRGETRLI
jgi:hypothetical protein